MKKDIILLDTVGEFALLYGFENLNEKAYWAYSTLSPKMIVLTNIPRYSGNCYSLYVKKVNDDYSLVSIKSANLKEDSLASPTATTLLSYVGLCHPPEAHLSGGNFIHH